MYNYLLAEVNNLKLRNQKKLASAAWILPYPSILFLYWIYMSTHFMWITWSS